MRPKNTTWLNSVVFDVFDDDDDCNDDGDDGDDDDDDDDGKEDDVKNNVQELEIPPIHVLIPLLQSA